MILVLAKEVLAKEVLAVDEKGQLGWGVKTKEGKPQSRGVTEKSSRTLRGKGKDQMPICLFFMPTPLEDTQVTHVRFDLWPLREKRKLPKVEYEKYMFVFMIQG